MASSQQIALITGASGGIGRELARLFAADGHSLALVARSADRLAQVADELHAGYGIDARILALDLSDAGAPEAVQGWLGDTAVNFLINNAGFAQYGSFTATDPAAEAQMMQLNMVTPTRITKLLLPSMLTRASGGILNVASTAAFQPGPTMAVYYATKAYMLSFSEALAEELRGTGVTVTTLCPGPTRSGFQDRAAMEDSRLVQGRIGDAGEVARAGYDGMMAGRRLVVPGLKNKLFVQALRLSPRALTTRVIQRLQERV